MFLFGWGGSILWSEPRSRAAHFLSLFLSLGTLTTYSSYNPKEMPVVDAALTVCVANSAFSLVAGVTVFSFLGHMSETNREAIEVKPKERTN